MYCKYCGTQIPDGSIFCISCGKRQSGPVTVENARQDVPPAQEEEIAVPPMEQEGTPAGNEFDWSSLNPVPEEPVKAEPDEQPAQQAAQNPWQEAQQNPWQQNSWQTPPQQSAYRSPYEEQKQPVYRNGRIDYGCSMNWYKFQIYFSMIPTALSYMILGAAFVILALEMEGYSIDAGYFYREFVNLLHQPQGLFLLYLPTFIPSALAIGVGGLAYGILVMVAWVKMIRLRRGGWILHLVLSALPALVVTINMLVLYIRVGQYIPGAYLMEIMLVPLIALAVGVLVLILQIIYFKKRAYLFVN